MPESVSTCSAYKMLTCIYLCRTLLFFAPYADFSQKNNSYYKDGQRVEGKANDLYYSNGGGIDPGFLENKMIKHAFDAYPKVRTGKYTMMATEQEDEEVIDYGIVDEEKVNEPVQSVASADDTKIPFGEEKQLDAPEPVQVEVSDDDADGGF